MARSVLVLDEVIAILETVGAPKGVIERFRGQADGVIAKKPEHDMGDAITVSSGFGTRSQRGFVELTLNNERSQMDAKKAREVGLMLIQSAEAAESDEIFVKLLSRLGLPDTVEARGRVLLDLREIRQGTRGTSWPT